MKNLEYKNFEIKQVSFSENDELVIGGYASKFNEKDALNPSWHPELKKIRFSGRYYALGCIYKNNCRT